MCLSSKFPGYADASGPGNHTLRTTELEEFYLQHVNISASEEFPDKALKP